METPPKSRERFILLSFPTTPNQRHPSADSTFFGASPHLSVHSFFDGSQWTACDTTCEHWWRLVLSVLSRKHVRQWYIFSDPKAFFLAIDMTQTQINIGPEPFQRMHLQRPAKECGISSWRRQTEPPACHGAPAWRIIRMSGTQVAKYVVIIRWANLATVTHGGVGILENRLKLRFRNSASTIWNPEKK